MYNNNNEGSVQSVEVPAPTHPQQSQDGLRGGGGGWVAPVTVTHPAELQGDVRRGHQFDGVAGVEVVQLVDRTAPASHPLPQHCQQPMIKSVYCRWPEIGKVSIYFNTYYKSVTKD